VSTPGGNDRPGLSWRVGKESERISSQHRQLDDHFRLVLEALSRGDLASAERRFLRFADALDAHLSLEDNFYFPALRGLAPALLGELESLASEHGEIRDEVARVMPLFDEARPDTCVHELERLAARMAEHERREERLLQRIQPQNRVGDNR
jgi:hypothetical protein